MSSRSLRPSVHRWLFSTHEVQLPWLLPFGRIHSMPHSTYMVIDYFAQPIRNTERLMFRQCMPRTERKLFAKLVLIGSVEDLLRNANRCHLVKGCLCLLPLRHGVFD